MAEFEGAPMCVECIKEMRDDGWKVHIVARVRFGVCEECGVEHSAETPVAICYGSKD